MPDCVNGIAAGSGTKARGRELSDPGLNSGPGGFNIGAGIVEACGHAITTITR